MYSDYSIPHGKAVATGIAIESVLSCFILGLDKSKTKRIISLLQKAGFNLTPPCSFNDMKSALKRDKKNSGKKILAALIPELGEILNTTPKLTEINDDALKYLESGYLKWLKL